MRQVPRQPVVSDVLIHGNQPPRTGAIAMEEGSGVIMPAIVVGLLLACFGYEVERRRARLRRVFGLLDQDELHLVGMLDTLVANGEIKALRHSG
jgi:hypothetical protein